MLERRSIQKLHRDERVPLLLRDLVDGANIRMVQCGSRTRLAAEPFERLRIARYVIRQELQRHKAAELSIFGLVNNAHPSAAKPFNDAVVGNRTAYEGQGIRHGWRTS